MKYKLINSFVRVAGRQPRTVSEYTTEEGLCGACLAKYPERNNGIVCRTCKALNLVLKAESLLTIT